MLASKRTGLTVLQQLLNVLHLNHKGTHAFGDGVVSTNLTNTLSTASTLRSSSAYSSEDTVHYAKPHGSCWNKAAHLQDTKW